MGCPGTSAAVNKTVARGLNRKRSVPVPASGLLCPLFFSLPSVLGAPAAATRPLASGQRPRLAAGRLRERPGVLGRGGLPRAAAGGGAPAEQGPGQRLGLPAAGEVKGARSRGHPAALGRDPASRPRPASAGAAACPGRGRAPRGRSSAINLGFLCSGRFIKKTKGVIVTGQEIP